MRYEFHLLGKSNICEIKKCIERVMKDTQDRYVFVIPSIEYIETILGGYGKIFGAYCENKLIGFISVVIPKKGKNNIGHYIHLTDSDLLRVVQLENIYIYPEFRSKGLGNSLTRYAIGLVESYDTILLSTISPINIPSLSIAFNLKQQIVGLYNIYGVKRYLMVKNYLNNEGVKNQNKPVELSLTNYIEINYLLSNGYKGISFNKSKDKILFFKE